MFSEKEIKEAMQQESRGTSDHQPLKFLVGPRPEPNRTEEVEQ
jgi:hypothetical protein